MRFEQACRFATSDSGYRIFAQSEGFLEQNASNMASLFNDVMNSVFGKVGQNLITLKISSSDAYFAKLTLRSDIKSRKSMFTNAAVIPIDFYSRMMMEDPTWMIHFPYNSLVSQRPGNEHLEAVEMKEYIPDKDALANICIEYGLDKPALTEFIIQLYKAVEEGSSLCLVTNLDSTRTPDLAVKYAALAASLLPPSLRSRLTFSSMGDARCEICVQSKDGGDILRMGKEIYQFQADAEKRIAYNNGRREVDMQGGISDMLVNFANLLSEKLLEDRTALETILYTLDEYSDKISGTKRGCFSFELLIISYYLLEDRNISLIEAVYLINELLQYVQAYPTDDSVANELLARWTNLLSEAGVCASSNITAPLMVRALDQKDDLLYRAVDSMMKYASDETRTGLAQIILQKDYSERQKHFVNELLIENPSPWSDELLEMLFAWSCRHNIIDLAPVIWARKNKQMSRQADNEYETAALIHQLIGDNIKQAQGLMYLSAGESLFNDCEMIYMANGLTEMCDLVTVAAPNEVLSDDEVKIVNTNYGDFSESLKEIWISYLVMFRYCSGKMIVAQVSSLKEIKVIFPDVFEDVRAALQSGQGAGQVLLEAYWTDTILGRCTSIGDLAEVCNEYNVSMDPKGVMETQFRQSWLAMTSFNPNKSLQEEMEYLMHHYDILEAIKLSAQTRFDIKAEITVRFWECVNMKELLEKAKNQNDAEYMRQQMMRLEHRPHADISAKMAAFYYTGDAFEHPENLRNHAFFRSVVEDRGWDCKKAAEDFAIFRTDMHVGEFDYSYSDIETIKDSIKWIATRHMDVLGVLYIDYYLYATYYNDEEKPDLEDYDSEALRKKLNWAIKKGFLRDETQLRLEDSELLNGPEAVIDYRKDIRKLITKHDPLSLQQFAVQLKGSKKGFLGFFGRKNVEDDMYEDE